MLMVFSLRAVEEGTVYRCLTVVVVNILNPIVETLFSLPRIFPSRILPPERRAATTGVDDDAS